MKKWYEGATNPGVIYMCNMFKVELAEYYVTAEQYRNKESKATKKSHEHIHRKCGSKALKKYDRAKWNLLTCES